MLKEFQNDSPANTHQGQNQHQEPSNAPSYNHQPPSVVNNPYNRNQARTYAPRLQQRRQPVQNPYIRRNQAPSPAPNNGGATITARMAPVINARVEHETNARMAEYVHDMEQDYLGNNEGIADDAQNGFFDH